MPFPIVEAFLLQPEEGKKGKIAICTNTLAPGMVSNEIPLDCRSDITALGSLVVNRDGAERMIINCLGHPTIEYIILFGHETQSFCPSTNLLSALMYGYADGKPGNVITGGRGVAHQYPSVAPHLLENFRKRFKVLPLFGHQASKEIVQKYLEWLRPNIPETVFACVKKILEKKEVYYDSLVELVTIIAKQPSSGVTAIELDPKDFQHLQPPIVELEGTDTVTPAPFEVKAEKEDMRVNIDAQGHHFTIKGPDSFLMAYSIMDHFNKNKLSLSPKEQLLLGVEMSRAEMEIRSDVKFPSTIQSTCKQIERKEIPLAPGTILKADKLFYYKIGLKDNKISVQSMAHDTCTSVFELRAKHISPIIDKLVKENRFEEYEQSFLHRADVGIEAGRAAIALASGYSYFQDFRNLFKLNKTEFPLLIAEGDSFLAVHQKIITALYTRGITAPHADTHKGMMRDACILAVFRKSGESLKHFPEIYASGTLNTTAMREQYKQQLLQKETDAEYSYGNRTRAHFGFDQLQKAVDVLKANPKQTVIVQRFDYNEDMSHTESPVKDAQGNVVRTRPEWTHDPCLTHDIYFIADNKLHSFHVARAHNIVNAYPENIFGLHDAYDEFVAKALGIELGDMFMLSSRGNMLLLTEEQKAKKLIAEPAKPINELDKSAGPVDLARNFPAKGIGVYESQLEERNSAPNHPAITAVEKYNTANLVEKASAYLKKRGDMHNNPILGTFDPKAQSVQGNLAFFQCNQRGGKLYATAVFTDGTKEKFAKDVEVCNYLATQYKSTLNLPLGNLTMFYVPVR